MMPDFKVLIVAVLVAALGLFLIHDSPSDDQLSPATTDSRSYWFGRYNFVTTVMLAGLGPPLEPSPQMIRNMAPAAGLDPERASLGGMAMAGGVYAGGSPKLPQTPQPDDMATLRWDKTTMDKRLTPEAQGYTLLKITAKRFHLDFHVTPDDRFAAIMMIPQAKAIVKLLGRMRTDEGTFAPRDPDGQLLPSQASFRGQVAVLWGLTSFFLRATDPADDYFARAYRKFAGPGGMSGTGQGQGQTPSQQTSDMSDMVMRLPVGEADALELMNQAYQSVHGRLNGTLSPAEQALAVEALGWFKTASAVSDNALNRALAQRASRDIHTLAERLVETDKTTLSERALAVYGLIEAGRITGNDAYREAAMEAFDDLDTLWDAQAGVYATSQNAQTYRYDPFTVGAVLAGLNAVRLFGPSEQAQRATKHFQTFFANAVVQSGLMQATGFPMMVAEHYRKSEPASQFTAPALTTPQRSGRAPVYASEVVYEYGRWRVTNDRFDTAQAMFLANVNVLLHGARTDGFAPLYRLSDSSGMNRDM